MSMFKGKSAQELGKTSEATAFYALYAIRHSWIFDVRYGTEEEDAEGIDLVVTTDAGDLPLQIKSGERRAKIFRSRRPDITTVTILPWQSERVVRSNIISSLKHARNKKLAELRNSFRAEE